MTVERRAFNALRDLMDKTAQNPIVGIITSVRTPISKSILLGVIHRLQEFDEDTLVEEFAKKMSEEVTPIFARNVREAVSDLTQSGLLGFRGGTEKYYVINIETASKAELQHLLRAPRSRTVLLIVIRELREFDDDTLVCKFAEAVNVDVTPKFARRVRCVITELVDYRYLEYVHPYKYRIKTW